MFSSRRYGGLLVLRADVPSAAKPLLHCFSEGQEVTGVLAK
jgi:hypothetical protein